MGHGRKRSRNEQMDEEKERKTCVKTYGYDRMNYVGYGRV